MFTTIFQCSPFILLVEIRDICIHIFTVRMASQHQHSPFIIDQAAVPPARMAAQLSNSEPTSEAMQALRFENQGLRGHSDFLAKQLWRQGQAYQQLAAYCHELCGEKTASATALAGVQAMLDATRFALESERQRHVNTQNSHDYEAKRRAASEKVLAKESEKVRDLILLFSKLSFMEPEDAEMVLNSVPDFSKLLAQALTAARGLTKEENDRSQTAFTLEYYKELVRKLKERHQYMAEYLTEKDVEIQRLREERHKAQPRTAVLLRRKA